MPRAHTPAREQQRREQIGRWKHPEWGAKARENIRAKRAERERRRAATPDDVDPK